MAACVVAAVFMAAAPASAQDEDAAARAGRLVESAIARYEASAGYELEFVQEAYWALADSTQTTRGTLAVSNPSRVSIRYANGGRIVVDADSLWVYVPDTNQFFRSALDPADVVADPARMLRQYSLDKDAPLVDRGDGLSVVRLRPREAGREPRILTVDIEAATGLVAAITARTSTGDRTSYRILNTRFDVEFRSDEFRLRRPPGSELIEGGPSG